MSIDASLLTGENAAFLDQQYTNWLSDPSSVDEPWRKLFETNGQPENGRLPVVPEFQNASIFRGRGIPTVDPRAIAAAELQAKVFQLVMGYRIRGHHEADLDPLGRANKGPVPELEPQFLGITEADLDQPVASFPVFGEPPITTVRNILHRMRNTYCGRIGIEFMNIQDFQQRRWLQERLETATLSLGQDEVSQIVRKLSDAENFERMLHNRFPGTKRFSIEGAETVVPLLDLLVNEAASHGVREIVFGMAHRGRLNVLANILCKPIGSIVGEFNQVKADTWQGSGDVKYHLGYSSDIVTRHGHSMHLSLTPNPSHLEVVDPVVVGRVRAKQDRTADSNRKTGLAVTLHGDAAFAGQGIVSEVLNLSDLKGYRTGGSVHLIINNQIGFTTSPVESRSTPYCTDVAKMLDIPIFHVNGEDALAVAFVTRIAMEWRQTFGRDVVIDMYCYRKHGHNEGDEPSFTQPLEYDQIRTRPTPREVVVQRLIESGFIQPQEVERILEESRLAIDAAGEHPAVFGSPFDSPLRELWSHYTGGDHSEVNTGIPLEKLQDLLMRSNTLPPTFKPHPKIVRLLQQRVEMIRGQRPIDWAVGEQAAYATLVTEGWRVRLSGQDCARGTFTHRHAALTDIVTGDEYFPVQHLAEGQATFEALDSSLSEAAVLGFEFGYSWDYPDSLIMWEAQFGDFANGAQVVIDQYLAAAEQKWGRLSGLVLLLPHGYEGQGPEHSSARLERFLQLCAEDNLQIANCTTPANFFHLLRRQVLRNVRKPLVVMTPKSLLRHEEAVSSMEDLAEGKFQSVIAETDPLDVTAVRRVVLCSGKIYYLLRDTRRKSGDSRVALIRCELLYPFPQSAIEAELAKYPADVEVVWCQEEPKNMGAWPSVSQWFLEGFPERQIRYVGRKAAASPATGSSKVHEMEQTRLVAEALAL